jgi:hypothetical protein
MSQTQCPYCDRVNPAGSKFCNACGAPLYLVPCSQCGAVNEAAATKCRQCGAVLPERTSAAPAASGEADVDAKGLASLHDLRQRLARIEAETRLGVSEADHPPPMSDAPRGDLGMAHPAPAVVLPPLPRGPRTGASRGARLVLGTAALAGIAIAGYYALEPDAAIEAPKAPMAAGEVTGSGDPAKAVPPASPATRADPAAVTSIAAPVPMVTHGVAKGAGPAPAASDAPPPDARPPRPTAAAPRENPIVSATPAAAAGALPRPAESGTGIERPPPAGIGPCTDAVAALGLCTPEPAQGRK